MFVFARDNVIFIVIYNFCNTVKSILFETSGTALAPCVRDDGMFVPNKVLEKGHCHRFLVEAK